MFQDKLKDRSMAKQWNNNILDLICNVCIFFHMDHAIHDVIVGDCCQIFLLMLSEFEENNQILFSLKSSGKLWFSDDIRRNRS